MPQVEAHCKSHLFSAASFHRAGAQRNSQHSRAAFRNTRALDLLPCRAIYSLKWCCKAKSQVVPSFIKQVPEDPTWDPRTPMKDHCRHRQGNSASWTSLHPSTTLASTFIRKAKWGIIKTPPQRRTALERQQLLPAKRDLSRKAGGCCKGKVANSLGNTKKAARKTPSPALKMSSSRSTNPLPANPGFVVEAATAPLRPSWQADPFYTFLHHLKNTKSLLAHRIFRANSPYCTALYSIKSCISWKPNYHLHSSFAIRLKL